MMSRTPTLILLTTLLMSLFIAFAPVHSVAAASTRVYVDPPVVVDPPEFFNISVKVENVQDLMGVELMLSWNPALLSGIKMTDVIYHETVPQDNWDNIWQLQNAIDNTQGEAYYIYTYMDGTGAIKEGYAPLSGNFTIFVIMFQVRSLGNCTLHFNISKLGAEEGIPIIHDTVDGFFSNSIPVPPSPLPPSPETQCIFYINPRAVRNESLTINSTFSISVELDNIANNSGLIRYWFDISYSSTLLKFISVADIMFHEVVNQTDTYLRSIPLGHLDFSCSLPSGYGSVLGNHTAAIVTFQVINVGKCPLQLSAGATNSAATNYICISKSGYFSNVMTGDLSGDHAVDVFDALLLAKAFGSQPEGKNWNEDADINGDGTIDVYDAILLCRNLGRKASPTPGFNGPIVITASDLNDQYERTWDLAFDHDLPPRGSGNIDDGADVSEGHYRGETMVVYWSLSPGAHYLIFDITQSGGPSYSAYSGTITIGGQIFNFTGMYEYNGTRIDFTV